MRNPWAWTAGLVGVVLLLILLLGNTFPSAVEDNFSFARVIYLLMLLAFVGSGAFAMRDANASFLIKSALAWIGIFLALLIGYSFRAELGFVFGRVKGEVTPSIAQSSGVGELTLYRGSNGHFVVSARVNQANTQFLIDTGASDVALTYADAERAGLEPWNLTFNIPYRTANGTTYAARIRIQSITIGDIVIQDVEGSVMKEGLGISLLGMSYLDRLSSYQVSGNKLTLRR